MSFRNAAPCHSERSEESRRGARGLAVRRVWRTPPRTGAATRACPYGCVVVWRTAWVWPVGHPPLTSLRSFAPPYALRRGLVICARRLVSLCGRRLGCRMACRRRRGRWRGVRRGGAGRIRGNRRDFLRVPRIWRRARLFQRLSCVNRRFGESMEATGWLFVGS